MIGETWVARDGTRRVYLGRCDILRGHVRYMTFTRRGGSNTIVHRCTEAAWLAWRAKASLDLDAPASPSTPVGPNPRAFVPEASTA